MKKLEDFMANIDEARTELETKEIKGVKGKTIAELNPDVDNSVMDDTGIDEEDMDENEERVQERFDFEKPFFILGHAGWAKTSIVKRLAKKNGYEVLIVYLDKACKEDLGGMPIVVDDPKYKGEKTTKLVPPEWAKDIIYNPDKKFLLFFDEMNQADPEVMNALMPIVQDNYIPGANPNDPDKKKRNRCENFLVGAAGNYKNENTATHKLSGPLMSRFKPLIIWEDNSDKAWENQFKFWRKEYEPIFGKVYDKFWPFHKLFDNPRELNEKLWDPYIRIKKKGLQNSKRYSADRIARYIYGGKGKDSEDRLLKKDINDAEALKYSKEIAEIIYDWLHDADNKGQEGAKEEEQTNKRRGSGSFSIPTEIKKLLDLAAQQGYIDGQVYELEDTIYVVSEENIYDIFDPKDINAESISQYLKILNQKGKSLKYKTTEEGLKDLHDRFPKKITIIDPATLNQ